MINTHIAMTDSIPSSFGMPVYGRALGASVGVDVCPQTTAVVLAAHVRHGPHQGRLPGDLCLETTELGDTTPLGSLQAAEPDTGIRGLCVSSEPKPALETQPKYLATSDQVTRR